MLNTINTILQWPSIYGGAYIYMLAIYTVTAITIFTLVLIRKTYNNYLKIRTFIQGKTYKWNF